MRRSGRPFRKNRHMLNDLSLTPLIDTALTLLIIFMIAAPMMQNAIRVTLPKGNAKEDGNAPQEMVVTIDKEGKLFFADEKISQQELLQKLKNSVSSEKEYTVFVRADQAVSYGMVIELVDTLKTVGGIKYVALATNKHA